MGFYSFSAKNLEAPIDCRFAKRPSSPVDLRETHLNKYIQEMVTLAALK